MAAHRLCLVAVGGGYSSLGYTGFSFWGLLLIQNMGSNVNGVEMGSDLAGHQIMEFWDRLCTGLRARLAS